LHEEGSAMRGLPFESTQELMTSPETPPDQPVAGRCGLGFAATAVLKNSAVAKIMVDRIAPLLVLRTGRNFRPILM
jgi:hypothetical protein